MSKSILDSILDGLNGPAAAASEPPAPAPAHGHAAQQAATAAFESQRAALVSASQELLSELTIQIRQVATQAANEAEARITAAHRAALDDLHQLAHRLEAELGEAKDRFSTDLEEIGRELVRYQHNGLDELRHEGERAVSSLRGEADVRAQEFDARVSSALESLQAAAEAHGASAGAMAGAFQLNAADRHEDDVEIG